MLCFNGSQCSQCNCGVMLEDRGDQVATSKSEFCWSLLESKFVNERKSEMIKELQ